ncbi:MAG: threonine ammonia-lyase [Candidatus Promineifilaceae bacterium]
MTTPTIADVQAAAERIRPYITRTPILTSDALNAQVGAELFFKCENLQKAGSFKSRGATNTVLLLKEAGTTDTVTTHSSGNHGAAVAMAAQRQGFSATIVMPRTAPAIKQANVASFGAEIVLCEPNVVAREAAADKVVAEQNATLIHPYDDVRVIAGQGTTGLEILEDVPDLDMVIAPVGGGGMLSGTALTMANLAPSVRVFGAEPEGADDAMRSMAAGHIIPMIEPNTIADGLLTSLGELTFPIIYKHVEKIYTVSEDEIITAMRLIWDRLKIIIEPSCSVTLAVVMKHPAVFKGKRIALVLTGGNIDLDKLPF